MGTLETHAEKIRTFLRELGISKGAVTCNNKRVTFSRHIDSALHQRIRNFLVNECPTKNS